VIVFVVSTAGAILLKPDFHIFMNFLANLGTGEVSGLLFNAGMMATAVLLAIFFLSLRPLLGTRQRITLGVAMGLAASAGLAGVGIFPAGTDSYHTFAAALFFLASALAVALFHLAVTEDRTSTPVSRASGVAYFAFGVLFVVLGRPWMENMAVVAFGIWLLAMVEVSRRSLQRRTAGNPGSKPPLPSPR
jgi:hypothetical membrane protein